MKQILVILLLAVTGVLGSLALIELPALIGIIDYRTVLNTIPPEPWQHPSNRIDPVLLHTRRPFQTLEGTQQGGDISFYTTIPDPAPYPYNARYDRNGFRNAKDPDSADIVVIGDSYIEALLTSETALLTTQLGTILGRTVVNLGQLWYGPQQQAEVFNRFALPLNPKVIVWVVFEGNDFTDYYRYQELLPQIADLERRGQSFFRRSFTRNGALAALRLIRPKTLAPPIHGRCAGLNTPLSLYFYEDHQTFGDKERLAVQATVDLISTRAAALRDRGVELVIAYAPSKIRTYRPFCEFDNGQNYPPEIRAEQAQLFAAGIQALSSPVSFLDLTPALQHAAQTRGAVYFRDDTHWNDLGHRVVAEALADHIRRVERDR